VGGGHHSAEGTDIVISRASRQQVQARHLLTGTSCDSPPLRFPLLPLLTMAATSRWANHTLIAQRQDLPNPDFRLFRAGTRRTQPPKAASHSGNRGLVQKTRSRRRAAGQKIEASRWILCAASTIMKPPSCSKGRQRPRPHRWIGRRNQRCRGREAEATPRTDTSRSARPHSTWRPGLQRRTMSSTRSWSPMPTRGTSTKRRQKRAR